MRLNREQIKKIMGLNRYSGTFYVVDFQQQMEFWDWCTDHGLAVKYEGTWTDRPVFRVIYDPCPMFTALRWA